MALYCIISEIKRTIGWESRYFHTPLHWRLPLWGPHQIISIRFGTEKLEWYGYQADGEKFDDMFSHFEYQRMTDRRIGRQTDILQQHTLRYAYTSRGKNRYKMYVASS